MDVRTFPQLQNAISQATASGAKVVVKLISDIAMLAQLVIVGDVTLHSETAAVLSGGGSTPLFYVSSSGKLGGENVTLRDGYANNGGAVFNNGGSLYFKSCTMTQNLSPGSGGAIVSLGSLSTMALNDCTITANSAGNIGGGAYIIESATNLEKCTISANSAGNSGGGAFIDESVSNFEKCTISANSATYGGGGIYSTDHATVITWDECTMTANSAGETGGGLVMNDGAAYFNGCVLHANSALSNMFLQGGALFNLAGRAYFDNCTLTANVAYWGGVVFNINGGLVHFDDCTLTANTATKSGGAIANEGGTMQLNDCTVTSNSAIDWGGGLYSSAGIIRWERCTLVSNFAPNAGFIDAYAGAEVEFTDCTLAANSASQYGTTVKLDDSAVASFFGCKFLGHYDGSECVVHVGDSDSQLLLFHLHAFESGVICSPAPVLVYNTNVSIPFSASYEGAAMTCQSEEIAQFCEYDCAAGSTGIICSCSPDGQLLELPYHLDDKVGSCSNSPLLTIPQTSFTVAWPKQRQPSFFQFVFANSGDNDLLWNLTAAKTNATVLLPWLLKPTAGLLGGCGLATVEVSLATWNLTAQASAYQLQLELQTNSYLDESRTILIDAFISANPVAASSSVEITNAAQLVAGDSVQFVVTPVDEAGVVVADGAYLAYFATLTHKPSSTIVACRVGYDSVTKRQQSTCEIPDLVCNDVENNMGECEMSPPIGEFTVEVKDAISEIIGATGHSFVVEFCPASYYQSNTKCVQCPDHVTCEAGSKISDWQLDPGYWRTSDESDDVHQCRFDEISCPGTNLSSGPDPYCDAAYIGPLCSQCADRYFMSWEGKGVCHECAAGQSHTPTIVLIAVVIVLGALIAYAFGKCCRRKPDAEAPSSVLFSKAEHLYALAKVKMFTIFLALQVTSQ